MAGIKDAIKRIKGYNWIKIPFLPSIEQYVASGDASTLKKIAVLKQTSSFWGSELVKALRSITQWQDEDRRIIHVLAAAGMEDDVWRWLDDQLNRESAGDDFHGTVINELQQGRKQDDRIAKDTITYINNLQTKGNPNSAGRYLLLLPAGSFAKAVSDSRKPRHYRGLDSVVALLFLHAPKQLDSLVEEFLLQPGEKVLHQSVVELLLTSDQKKFVPVIASLVKERQDKGEVFYPAEALYKIDPKLYRDLAKRSFLSALSEGGEGPAEFLMKTFDKEVLADVIEHLKSKSSGYDEKILKTAVEVYKADALPAVLAMLDRTQKEIKKIGTPKPNDYSARWSLQRLAKTLATLVDHLITINDGALDDRIVKEIEAGLASDDSSLVISFLTLAGKWNLKRMKDRIAAALQHKSKPAREAAVLSRLGDKAVTIAEPLLEHKKADVRTAAALVLATVNTPQALEILEKRLDKEDNDDVRDQMLLGLESAWAKEGRKTSRKDVEKRIARCGDKLNEPIANWVKIDKLPELRWSDGGKINKQGITYLLYRQSRCREIRPDVEAKSMYELIDRKSSGEFASTVLAGFIASKQEASDRWALTVACKLGDDRLVPELGKQIREWVDTNRGKLAEYAVQALALLGSDAALLSVDAMAIRYRSKMKNVGKAAAEAFAGAADALGISTEELGDRVVPWLGFEPGRSRMIESSSGKFEVSIGMDFKLAYKDVEKNKPVKSLPKSLPKETLNELKEISANLKEAAKAQMLRVENLLVRQRRWSVARWKQLFLLHPMLLPFAVRLVWGHYDDSGKLLKLFRALVDRSLTTIEDETYDPPSQGVIGIVHPLELDEATRKAWQVHLADYEIDPPFPQMKREVVHVAEGDARRKTFGDFKGESLNAMTFKGRAEKLGWHRGSVVDGGGITCYVKSFSTAGADVILGVEDFYIGIDMYSDMQLGDAMFVKTGSVRFASYEYDEPGNESDPRVLEFAQVPPIVFSEAMGDLRKIAGKKQEEPPE